MGYSPYLKVSILKITNTNSIVNIDEEDSLVEFLAYDETYNLAICIKCQYALPLEWICKHFKDSHKVKVRL